MHLSRRRLLQMTGADGARAITARRGPAIAVLQPAEGTEKPLLSYTNRDSERVYRDHYAYDRTSLPRAWSRWRYGESRRCVSSTRHTAWAGHPATAHALNMPCGAGTFAATGR